MKEALDELLSTGAYQTRAAAVRSTVESLVDHEWRRRTGEEIATYRRLPQSDEDRCRCHQRRLLSDRAQQGGGLTLEVSHS
jgi:Arc/MetJ-type ribon-helix-helix transcriptional regulator